VIEWGGVLLGRIYNFANLGCKTSDEFWAMIIDVRYDPMSLVVRTVSTEAPPVWGLGECQYRFDISIMWETCVCEL
jgi:hypothetical protein